MHLRIPWAIATSIPNVDLPVPTHKFTSYVTDYKKVKVLQEVAEEGPMAGGLKENAANTCRSSYQNELRLIW